MKANKNSYVDELGPWVHTYLGKKIHPFNPQLDEIDIVDIAHSLAMQCRYNGHSSSFFSVAQHSVLVSQHCESKLEGLLHDAAEAYLTDVPRPIKPYFPNYTEFEDKLTEVIFKKYGANFPIPAEVKQIDNSILFDEGNKLMTDTSEWECDVEPLGIEINPIGPEEAKTLFLERFNELTNTP